MKKNILGLDLGTNSIGWALVERDIDNHSGRILGMGSRIIPMDGAIIGDFEKGNSISQTAERTRLRSIRRLRERHLLRRERLHRVLNVLGFLPEHYSNEIDFTKRLGQFINEGEPKIAWKRNESGKFEFLFRESFNEMVLDFGNKKIPYDWTIYYLRKKALIKKISKEELAWLILNFNQKRGYNQLRGEEDEDNTNTREYVMTLKIEEIKQGEADKKKPGRTWYTLKLSNGWEYSSTYTTEPRYVGMEKDFLIVEELDENGNIKIVKDNKKDTLGKEKRRISPLPTFDEINLMSKAEQDKIYGKIKARTEATINNSGNTVGVYIYESLTKNPSQKLNGKLVRTIERKYYKDELTKILAKQHELQPELFSEEKYSACVRELYRNNDILQMSLSKKNFIHLIVEDIIFYQRPLRSQKSGIGNCSLEYVIHRRSEVAPDGNRSENSFKSINKGSLIEIKSFLKATPKSNPYYQEFRLWQWIKNLSIYDKTKNDENVNFLFLNSSQDYEKLFDFLYEKKEIEQKQLLKFLVETKNAKESIKLKPRELAIEIDKYRWNYVEDKKYPCNPTYALIKSRMDKVPQSNLDLNFEMLYQLWHIIYSVTDKVEFESALETFARKNNIYHVKRIERNPNSPDKGCFVYNFKSIPPFKSEFGAYSEKAIKKLLPLMRMGKYWSWENINEKVKSRIDKIINAEFDEAIQQRVREKTIDLTEREYFQGLPEWLAKYVVYNRHSESSDSEKWLTPKDIELFLGNFKQHSLRNPIVEQIVIETLRVVKDIWGHYGESRTAFFDEIHIELGREMKNNAEERKKITNNNTENENTNTRIKSLLMELLNDKSYSNVRPQSPMQQDILRIYENYALNTEEKFIGKDEGGNDVFVNEPIPDDIIKISKLALPTQSELLRYKLWLEQKYRSPYTGQMIPLSKLFTSAYEIEHVIPQSRYFDDSFNNKVICEMAVNKLKDRQLGLEFIKNHHGETVETGQGKEKVRILEEEEYLKLINRNYENNRSKKNRLLMEEIPEKMIERQMNDTRYISKYISALLSNIVREVSNDDGVNSKNVLPLNGSITSRLRQDWGLNDVWNTLILPRFERMNLITNTNDFTATNKEGHLIPTVPFEYSKGFQKKRIDHRHHALDALVIACVTRDHVNLLNNQSAKSDSKRYDLQKKLRNSAIWKDDKGKEKISYKEFKMPWDNFPLAAKEEISQVIVSFKQNIRVVNKATNQYERFENGKKIKVEQKGVNWAIRKPLHKDTVYGKVNLQNIKVPKGKVLTATRKNLDTSFNEAAIKSVTDTGIQKILSNYLREKGNSPEIAFSPEGIEELNKNIQLYNDGKFHQPINKVRIFELGSKFALGQKGNKKHKFVEAAKGTNLFFAIYLDENKKRTFETIPLNVVIERQKQGISPVPETNERGHTLLFYLSPNDLVYVPADEEREDLSKIRITNLTKVSMKGIYKTVSFSGSQCFFLKQEVATSVVNKAEFSKLNKMEKSIDEVMIKEVCIKLKIDRLGNISM